MNTGKFTLFFTSLTLCTLAHAAVYTWVDANGKTHYSDQPLDKKSAREIEITPTNIMEGGNEFTESAARYKKMGAEASSAEQAREKPQLDPCAADLAMYRDFTQQQYYPDGRPKRYYLNNKDGSSMTEKQQTEILQNLVQDLNARGCL